MDGHSEVDATRAGVLALAQDVAAGLIGHDSLVERLLIAYLTGGHVLLEGPPGIAKTRAVKQLAARLPGGHARIQCTPDLLPSDLTGSQVFRPETGRFDFLPGPVFHNIVLVDEINRAPPKVQSALLEAMAEGQVTTGGVTRPLPDPFMVVATQNPIEHEGTFPLPEAQMDRFLLHLRLDLPGADHERAILDLVEAEGRAAPPTLRSRIDAAGLAEARAGVAGVTLAPVLKDFIIRLVMATRPGGVLAGAVDHAVSPRGTLALAGAVRARAWLRGRDHGLPEDVQALAPDALAHRLVPSWKAVGEGRDGRRLIAEALEEISPW
ncbi:AAA family ATPase [Paracoccus hibiscisoli]|uniref:MoxR family ATPase n=1 Tax=Paracoccus hibiscisoli TaxID=2023261 RepID=A0A4U0R8Y2_9RHOB|nr:MoxR family ATPase [Paracoccus hibiscisoli]TJZ84624.1 MoxR family ATPase [Paracoccus hibiscisoli]